VLAEVALTALAGVGGGCLGAMLGIGGGVFLVPFLHLVIGLPLPAASGISLVTIIATSSVTSAMPGRLPFVNLRLGLVLEAATALGALIGVLFVHRFADSTLEAIFGGVLVLVALLLVLRLDRPDGGGGDVSIDVGALGGRYRDPKSGDVAYRVRRLPIGLLASVTAGMVSVLGIGGGVLKVPAMNLWCGVPMRVATSTSALMLGITALVGALSYYLRGAIVLHLAAATVLGVLVGSRLGYAIAARSRAKHLKGMLAFVVAAVALIYLRRAAG
jgi:uncharacterized membrane protein YfcA